MFRRIRLTLALVVIGWSVALVPVHSAEDKAQALATKLEMKISLESGIAANTPLQEALTFFSDRYGITLVLDEAAFEKAKIEKISEKPIGLKPIKEVRLGAVLTTLLNQVEGTYKIDKDRIVIGPKAKK